MKMEVRSLNKLNELYELRGNLHRCPEVAFNEYKTQKIILDFIEKHIVSEKFNVLTPMDSSIIIEYHGGEKDSPFTIFRADMDALSIQESTDNPVVSENEGIMHACGHDIHMTVLVGLIVNTAEKLPERNFLFVFQPAEEGAGGAKKMMDQGIFDSYKVNAAFALHVTDDYKIGSVATNDNILFAIPREINIVFKGKSSHAAFPHNGNDAISASVHFLNSVYQMVAKEIDPMQPFLFHVGTINGGDARNITAKSSVLTGTLRALTMETMDKGSTIVNKAASQSADLFGCKYEIETPGEYLPVINSSKIFNLVKTRLTQVGVEFITADTKLVGEDFGYFCDRYPSLMLWLGALQNEQEPISLHSQHYFPDNSVIKKGVEIMSSIASISLT